MDRVVLDVSKIHPAVQARVAAHKREFLEPIWAAVAQHPVVVLGMAQNPFCKRVRRDLQAAGIPFHYMEYGSYLSRWRDRNAIKMWTGWPTFPQVFVRGHLVGGAQDTRALIDSGELARWLQSPATVAPGAAAAA